MTPEALAIKIAEATRCGYGDMQNGVHVTMLCCDQKLLLNDWEKKRYYFKPEECDCLKAAKVALQELQQTLGN